MTLYGESHGLPVPPSPGAYPLLTGDRLYLRTTSRVKNVPVTLRARILRPDGTLHPTDVTHKTTDTLIPQTEFSKVLEGWLLSITIIAKNSNAKPGTIYSQAGVIGQGNLFRDAVAILAQGYVEWGKAITWPFGRHEESDTPQGYPEILDITPSTPNTPATYNVPRNIRHKLRALYTLFTPTASVPGSAQHLIIQRDGQVIHRLYFQCSTVNDVPNFLYCAPNTQKVQFPTYNNQTLPSTIILQPGDTVTAGGSDPTNPATINSYILHVTTVIETLA